MALPRTLNSSDDRDVKRNMSRQVIQVGVGEIGTAALAGSAGLRLAAIWYSRPVYLLCETALRAAACSAETVFLYAAILAYLRDPARISLPLVAASSVFTIVAFVLSRAAIARDWHPLALATLPVIYGFPVFLSVRPGPHLVPVVVATAVQVVALGWIIYAKWSLGRSFGLLPANRGIVVSGAYRWMRHPIYLGYILCHGGFLLASFSWRNLAVYCTLHLVQIGRLLREEKLLSRDGSYLHYRQRVRYRLIPGVF
jgi:protein-S-isoprenylcysteine O-methyltransferase Ste14